MRQMREHGTPGHKTLPCCPEGRHGRPFSSRPGRAEGGRYRDRRGKCKRAPGIGGPWRSMRKIESNSLDLNQACCRFSSTVAAPQQPNQLSPAIQMMRARTDEEKEGAMRVRVIDGRLLGLDIGDWWTLLAGSTVAGLLAFFL